MARTVEELIQAQIGTLVMQVVLLTSKLEEVTEERDRLLRKPPGESSDG